MMSTTPNNKKGGIRFGGAEDTSVRSAWKSLSKSLLPPSPAQRQASLCLSKEMAAAYMVECDVTSSELFVPKHEDADKVTTIVPIKDDNGSLKLKQKKFDKPAKAKTLPSILKSHSGQDPNPPLEPSYTQAAWGRTETSNSNSSIFGLKPRRRQKSLDELDLEDVCDQVKSIPEVSSSSEFDSSLVLEDIGTPSTSR